MSRPFQRLPGRLAHDVQRDRARVMSNVRLACCQQAEKQFHRICHDSSNKWGPRTADLSLVVVMVVVVVVVMVVVVVVVMVMVISTILMDIER